MPLQHIRKNALAVLLNHVPMTGHDAIEIPRANPATTLPEPGPIPLAGHVPNEPPLPQGIPARILERGEKLGEKTGGGIFGGGARILLVGGQVEDQIRGDEGAIGPVIEDQFPVGVRAHVLVIELPVQFRPQAQRGFVALREDVRKGETLSVRGRFALLGEAVDADDGGAREGSRPVREVDVVLEVERD